jgi:hypothetical protein
MNESTRQVLIDQLNLNLEILDSLAHDLGCQVKEDLKAKVNKLRNQIKRTLKISDKLNEQVH